MNPVVSQLKPRTAAATVGLAGAVAGLLTIVVAGLFMLWQVSPLLAGAAAAVTVAGFAVWAVSETKARSEQLRQVTEQAAAILNGGGTDLRQMLNALQQPKP